MFVKNKFLLITILIISTVLASTVFMVNIASADQGEDVPATSDTVSLTNPLSGNKANDVTPAMLIGKVINAVLGLVGSIALAMFIWGGFSWMTAGGNTEKVQKGKDIIIWAALGLVIIFSAYALVNFVISDVIGA